MQMSDIFSHWCGININPLRPCRLQKNETSGLSDFQSRILQTIRRPNGSDFTLSVQARVHPELRDYDQSFEPTSASPKVGYYFLAMNDATTVYLIA
jgi:hypothetical protein